MFCKTLCFIGIIVVCATFTQTAKLPNYLNKCKKDDGKLNECILSTIKSSYKKFADGDQTVHLQSLNPLKVPSMHLDVNGGLIIDLMNCTITGFETAEFKTANFDLDKKEMEFNFHVPDKINLVSEYDINGRILILPIQGKGPCNITFLTDNIKFKVDFDINEKSGKQYIIPKKNDFSYVLKRAYFQLDNLFNGDPRLGPEMLKFLNENWKEVNDEVGVKVAEAIGEVLMQVLGSFFKKVPLNEFFEN